MLREFMPLFWFYLAVTSMQAAFCIHSMIIAAQSIVGQVDIFAEKILNAFVVKLFFGRQRCL